MSPPERPHGEPESGRRPWIWELSALAIALVGVGVRCLHWRCVFTPEGVVVPGTDPYYHLWRAGMLARDFPGLSVFDPWISFPKGAPIPWPPGFDLLVASPSLLGMDARSMAVWGAVLVPLLGGVAVYLTWRLGRRLIDPLAGLLAAGLLALMSGAIEFSHVGRVDHHALVAVVCLGMFLCLLASLEAAGRTGRIAWGCACGFLAAVSVVSWSATPPVYFLPVPLTLLLLRWDPDPGPARLAARWCLGSALVLVTLAVLLVGDLAARPFDLYYPSWFTVMLFFLATLAVLGVYLPPRRFIALGLLVLAAALALVFLTPGTVAPLLEALGVARGADPSYRMPFEASRMLLTGEEVSLHPVIARYTYLVLLVPVVWLAHLAGLRKSGERPAGKLLLAGFGFLGVLLVAVQVRFGEYGAPAIALLLAWGISAGGRLLGSFWRSGASRNRARLWIGLSLLSLGLALSPLATSLVEMSRVDLTRRQRELVRFGRELGEHTPEPGPPSTSPGYGLLASWHDSHALLYSARRPVMVSSFGTAWARAGNQVGFALLLAGDEEAAFSKLDRRRIGYLVVSPMVPQIPAMSYMIGRPRTLVVKEISSTAGGVSHAYRTRPAFFDSLYARLYYGDGAGQELKGEPLQALSHFRLHRESAAIYRDVNIPGRAAGIPMFKAFQVVRGARISGVASPKEKVQLRLGVQTNTGRRFTYQSECQADADGGFRLVVPYATSRAGGPCRIRIGQRVEHIQVAEQDVIQGRTLHLEQGGR